MNTTLDIDRVIEDYYAWLVRIRDFDPKTIRYQQLALGSFRTFLVERGRPMEQAGPEDAVAWINHRVEEGVRHVTIKGHLCVLRTFYGYLQDFGHIGASPVACLPEMICEGPAEQAYLTVPECRRLLAVFDRAKPVGHRDYLLMALLWSTGLRTAEVCALTWRDIDLGAAVLQVRRGKNRRQRVLFLNDRLLQDLRNYREAVQPRTAAEPVFFTMRSGTWSEADRPALTCRGICNIFQAHAPRAGIDRKISPKTLRHTFATHMYERGVAVEDIKEMMGHDTETETCIYIHVSVEAAKLLLLAHIANRDAGR